MKLRTTVYSHKVVDVASFESGETPTADDIYDLYSCLAELTISSLTDEPKSVGYYGKKFRIKVDRPLSPADKDHRVEVKEREQKKNAAWRNRLLTQDREADYAEYLRLKERFEG